MSKCPFFSFLSHHVPAALCASGCYWKPTVYKILLNNPSIHQPSITWALQINMSTPNEFNVRINAQQRTDSKPFSDESFSYCDHARRRQLPGTVNCGESIRFFQMSANTAIHRSTFLQILILRRIYSLSNYTWSSYPSGRLIPYGTYVWDALVRNKVQHTAVLQLLCDFFAYVPKG